MKKVFALALALVLALSLAACGGSGEKVQIGIPADATNGARALLLLQDQGLITLKEGVGLEATEKDIAENPYNIEIVPMEAANLPASLPDLNLAVINGNYASGAGIADKVLLTEDAESVAAQTYGNVICVKEGNENNPAVQALVAVLMSQDVQDWISQNYNGVVMPMGAQELDIPEISEPVTLKVGASPSPHAEILEYAKSILAEHNVELEIVEFDDYVMPNTGVEDGSLDANYFQHQPYLDDFNAEQGTHLVSVATVHYEPMGLYPGKSASVDEIKQG
jgi:D-methionine transport system substrate-binding protein